MTSPAPGASRVRRPNYAAEREALPAAAAVAAIDVTLEAAVGWALAAAGELNGGVGEGVGVDDGELHFARNFMWDSPIVRQKINTSRVGCGLHLWGFKRKFIH